MIISALTRSFSTSAERKTPSIAKHLPSFSNHITQIEVTRLQPRKVDPSLKAVEVKKTVETTPKMVVGNPPDDFVSNPVYIERWRSNLTLDEKKEIEEQLEKLNQQKH